MYKKIIKHKFRIGMQWLILSALVISSTIPGIVPIIQATTMEEKLPNFNEHLDQGDITASLESDEQIVEEISNNEEISQTAKDKLLDNTPPSSAVNSVIASGTYGSGTTKWTIENLSDGNVKLNLDGGIIKGTNDVSLQKWSTYPITQIEIISPIIAEGSLSNFFLGLKEVKSIEGLNIFDTSAVTDMQGMFRGMSSLTSLDISSFDMSHVTNMSAMFYDDPSLTSLNVSDIDTSLVTDMSSMFYNDSNLTSLNLSDFDTSNVKTMKSMFRRTSALTTIDLSNFDFSHCTDFENMFRDASSIIELDLSYLKSPSDSPLMNYMFSGMSSLVSLDISNLSNKKTYAVNKSSMFDGDNKLFKIKLGADFEFGSLSPLPDIVSDKIYTGKWINATTGKIMGSSSEFTQNYKGGEDSGTYIWQSKLEVDTKQVPLPLGGEASSLSVDSIIEDVRFAGETLKKEEYTAEVIEEPDTSKLGDQSLKLRVTLKSDADIFLDVTSKANIVWGSTLVVEDSNFSAVDVSISLLNKSGQPILNANQGSGYASNVLSTMPYFIVYRGNEDQTVSVGDTEKQENPEATANRWNSLFNNQKFQYGDVIDLTVYQLSGEGNLHGEDTFVSRNEQLVKETVGYDDAYYELTKEGYRLLHLNQMTVNKGKHIPLHTSKAEMDKHILDYITLPETIENQDNYRIEFQSVETNSSGKKSSLINVYEKLESGGEFLKTYTIDYVVDPLVTEYYYDTENHLLEEPTENPFTYGTSFTAAPEKYREVDGVLYIYRGWSEEKPSGTSSVLKEGVPETTESEKDFYYIYEKADKLINVTIPTEIVFGTLEETKKISSLEKRKDAYKIENHSSEVDLQVDLSRFDKVTSDVELLDEKTPEPSQKSTSARLDLMLGNQPVVSGLTESISEQKIAYLSSGQSNTLGLSGTYFGDFNEKHKVEYNMVLKFKAQVDEKN